MKRLCLAMIIMLATASAFAQDQMVRCESMNGRLVQCGYNGVGNVTLTRTLNDSSCIQGQSWGYSGTTIWVDRGCRADFLVTAASTTLATQTVICESGRGRHTCLADTSYGVRLSRQLSKSNCVAGKSWGYTSNGIWVSRGCRAEFLLGPMPMTSASSYRPTLVCESINNTRHRCQADTSYGVQIGHQISDNACILNDSWGWDSKGIWVDRGCRAEFILGH